MTKINDEEKIWILGAGAEAELVLNSHQIVGYQCGLVDPLGQKKDEKLKAVSIDVWKERAEEGDIFVTAMGSNEWRKKLYEMAEKMGLKPFHIPRLDSSSTVMHQCSVELDGTQIGKGCIINNGAVICHDCTIGDFTHIAPSATICGNVDIGDMCFIGANSTVLQETTIPNNSMLKAGAVYSGDESQLIEGGDITYETQEQ